MRSKSEDMPNANLSVVLKALADRVEHLELIAARCGLSVDQVRDAIGGLRAKGYRRASVSRALSVALGVPAVEAVDEGVLLQLAAVPSHLGRA